MSDQVEKSVITGTRDIDGIRWDVYDHRASGSHDGNVDYALVAHAGDSTVILSGTADDTEFRTVASSLVDQIHSLGGEK